MTLSCLVTLSISSLRYLYIEANTFYDIAYLIMQHLLQGVILNMFFDFILTWTLILLGIVSKSN